MAAAAIELVELTATHLPAVRALWQASKGLTLREADSPEALTRYLARNPGLSVAAFAGGELIAAALCGHDGRRGYLHHVSVHPAHRRRGIGRRLVERCLDRLAAAGIAKCHLFVRADNDAARAFWQRLGWQARDDVEMMSSTRPGHDNA